MPKEEIEIALALLAYKFAPSGFIFFKNSQILVQNFYKHNTNSCLKASGTGRLKIEFFGNIACGVPATQSYEFHVCPICPSKTHCEHLSKAP